MNEVEMLSCGYGLVEGPRVDGDDNLYFSDVHRGGVYRRRPDGTIETVVPKRRGVGGIALHTDGGLVISGRNICHVRDGETRVVFAPDAPGLNDLFVDGAGRVICGTIRSDPFSIEGPRTAGECWLIDADGIVTELYGDVALTNGIGLSPDGTVLYHSDTTRGIWAHDYDDGKVTRPPPVRAARRPLARRPCASTRRARCGLRTCPARALHVASRPTVPRSAESKCRRGWSRACASAGPTAATSTSSRATTPQTHSAAAPSTRRVPRCPAVSSPPRRCEVPGNAGSRAIGIVVRWITRRLSWRM